MKSIKECCNYATPMNTSGIGNPSAPEITSVGSGDIPISTTNIKLKKKKMKHIKDFIKR